MELLARSKIQLKKIAKKLIGVSRWVGLEINGEKTKYIKLEAIGRTAKS